MATGLPARIPRFWRRFGSFTIKYTTALCAIVAALLSFAQPSVAQPFNKVIVFGDSNVDSGYYKALSNPGGSATYNSLWPTAVADGAGAPTTNPGKVKSQVLASILGLTANPANTSNGTNYATSGAKNVTVNNAQTGGFTAAIPTVTQIANYLAANGGVANSRALYLIDSGDNDATYAAGETGAGPFPSNPQAYVTQAAGQLAAAIQSLFNAGARSIIVAGLNYDFPSSDANLRSLKLLYTQTLWSDLTSLGVPFFQADTDPLLSTIVSHPVLFGFTTVSSLDPACTTPTGITTAWASLCSSNPGAPRFPCAPNRDRLG
jgi:outer membrane lipase/esterase